MNATSISASLVCALRSYSMRSRRLRTSHDCYGNQDDGGESDIPNSHYHTIQESWDTPQVPSSFLPRAIPASVERVYAILGNLAMHKAVDFLLFNLAHPRWEVVFQPTSTADQHLIEPRW